MKNTVFSVMAFVCLSLGFPGHRASQSLEPVTWPPVGCPWINCIPPLN